MSLDVINLRPIPLFLSVFYIRYSLIPINEVTQFAFNYTRLSLNMLNDYFKGVIALQVIAIKLTAFYLRLNTIHIDLTLITLKTQHKSKVKCVAANRL